MKTKPLEQKIEEILAYYESDGSNITMPKTVKAISKLVKEARIDEISMVQKKLNKNMFSSNPQEIAGTLIGASQHLMQRLSDLKSNKE